MDGVDLGLVSLHFTVPHHSLQLWNPDHWRWASESRTRNLQEGRLLEQQLAALGDVPVIVGGDFNAVPSNPALATVRNRYRDVFAEAGVGLGGTLWNHRPLLRIDHILVSGTLFAGSAKVVRSEHSDHRLVLAEVVLPPHRQAASRTGGLQK